MLLFRISNQLTSGKITIEQALFDVVSLKLSELFADPNRHVNNEFFEVRNLQSLCSQFNLLVVGDDSHMALSLCYRAAEEIHDCVQNRLDELRQSFSATSDPGSFANLINMFQENRFLIT
ncbi:hypothetical protein RF11_11001 [Thelohanellus kitauei]|uniref:Uncharacterized protein n=1 Tax=Thelohanellus kitauei TaxID=669202 RepID=A0A0C2IYH2_THEKT|nr:hypothetical protein RF11_11001 [Thelohanellus kitauei]